MNIDDAIKFAHDGTHGAIAAALAREVLRLREVALSVTESPAKRDYPHKGDPGPETVCGKFNYWFFRGWQACAAKYGNVNAIEAERNQRKRDDRESWIQANRECGVDL